MKRIAPSLLALLCISCASFGHKIDLRQADQLQPGIATRADAERLFGKPTAVSVGTNGVTVLVWTYSAAVLGSVEAHHLSLMFGPDGKLLRKSQTTVQD